MSLGRGQGTVMGVEKQVYTLLIWTLLLVLSLPTLSRASKPRIASIAMNSILRTCRFINSCVYSRSTGIHNACPSSVCTLGTTLVQVHKYIYIHSPQDQNLHGSIDTLGRDSLAFNCLQQSLDPMYYNKP